MSAHLVGVAEHDGGRRRSGRIHRLPGNRLATAKRNRSQYRVRCGITLHAALPVDASGLGRPDLCGACWRGVDTEVQW